LTREGFNIALALRIEKVVARMTTDQTGARALFHELGFQNEALLKDHVKDRNGTHHDLLLMACDVQTFLSTRNAYGVVN
jgi:RimJ/RimL family protein N-acetyltransferase